MFASKLATRLFGARSIGRRYKHDTVSVFNPHYGRFRVTYPKRQVDVVGCVSFSLNGDPIDIMVNNDPTTTVRDNVDVLSTPYITVNSGNHDNLYGDVKYKSKLTSIGRVYCWQLTVKTPNKSMVIHHLNSVYHANNFVLNITTGHTVNQSKQLMQLAQDGILYVDELKLNTAKYPKYPSYPNYTDLFCRRTPTSINNFLAPNIPKRYKHTYRRHQSLCDNNINDKNDISWISVMLDAFAFTLLVWSLISALLFIFNALRKLYKNLTK